MAKLNVTIRKDGSRTYHNAGTSDGSGGSGETETLTVTNPVSESFNNRTFQDEINKDNKVFIERLNDITDPNHGGYTHYLGFKRGNDSTRFTKIAEIRPTAGNTAYIGFTLFGGTDYGFGENYSEITGQIGVRNSGKRGTVYQVGNIGTLEPPRIGIVVQGTNYYDIYVEVPNHFPTYTTFTTKGAPAVAGAQPVINWTNESSSSAPSGIQWYDTTPKGVSEGLILSDPANESKNRTNQSEVNKDIKSSIWSSNVQVGNLSKAEGNISISIGESSEAKADSATVVGRQAKAEGYRSTAISRLASTVAGADYATVVGYNSTSGAPRTVNVGVDTVTQAPGAIAIGDTSQVSGANGIRIGTLGNSRENCVVIGPNCSTVGTNNTVLGPNSFVSGSYSTAIGADSRADNANEIRLGASTLSILSAYQPLTTISDRRDKTDINDIDNSKALEFINKLTPSTYKRAPRDIKTGKTPRSNIGERKRIGFIAQDVQEALKSVYGDDPVDIVNDNYYDGEKEGVIHQLSVAYTNIIPMLTGAIKELTERIEKLEKGDK